MTPATAYSQPTPNAAGPEQAITTPKELAARMARLAHRLREVMIRAFAADRASDLLVGLRETWAAAVMPGLAQPAHTGQFADMCAQTVVYAFFAARCSHPAGTSRFQRLGPAAEVLKTNPLLRRLLETVTGPQLGPEPYAGLIEDLTRLLDGTDLDAVLQAFGRRGARHDAVAHFYETFLAEYNPRLRKARGVYSTPEPVVSFIVRAVDDLLRTRFGVPGGLAENMRGPHPGKATAGSSPEGQEDTPPRVLVIDPACGTGNFLCGVIGHVRDRFMRQGNARMWSSYVRRSLLPRVHGFELLLAPYAVARLQLGRQLAGHDLPAGPFRQRRAHELASDERLGVHLVNSLDDAAERAEQLFGPLGLTKEPAESTAEVPRDLPILVVLGNPPYRGFSASRGAWIARLLDDYRLVNGEPLGEKKVWLKNDYVQFIRLGQWGIERTGRGILAFVTDHSYLDSPTFRGMRQSLLKTFDEIYVLNLHGNAKRRDRAPDGSKDENVFAIRQGVAIALFLKQGKNKPARRVVYADLWGSRQSKWERLTARRVAGISWKKITPVAPGFELVAVNRTTRGEYDSGWPLKEIFPVGSNGVQTSRDHLVVAFDAEGLLERLQAFVDADKTEGEVRRGFFGDKSVGDYPPGDTRQWKLGQARAWLRQNRSWRRAMAPYAYRPFDERCVLYLDSMVDWPRREVMRHLRQPNQALCVGRAGLVASGSWDLVFCVNGLCDHNLFYRGSSKNFPLYLYPSGKLPESLVEAGNGLRPNLSARFVEKVTETLGLRFVADRPGDLRKTVGPEDILHYAYAVFHSPTYRRRYAELLKYDFPRLPLTADAELFRALCTRGGELVRLHGLAKRDPAGTALAGKGDDTVHQVRYVEPGRATPRGRVWINETQYFEGVAPEVWWFHIGGYRVCQKWLKDRKGRRLSSAEGARYVQIVAALTGSFRLMHDIDAAVEEYGGWPIR